MFPKLPEMSTNRCLCSENGVDSYNDAILQVLNSTTDCGVCGSAHYTRYLDSYFLDNIPVYPSQKSSRKKFTSRRKRTYRNTSVYQYFMNSLVRSSIYGVSNWAKSKSTIWTFLWSSVLIACAAGYGYQTFAFYKRYRSNPTVVNIQVENDGQVEFPAITICNANR